MSSNINKVINGDINNNIGKEMVIRPMSESDLEQVTLIENECFSVPWSRKSFADAFMTPENIYLVCDIDGEIAGYCGLWTVLGEGNITNMAVAPHFRKQGIGAALMAEMERLGREKDVDIFFLEVRESNEAAQKLYQKMGYMNIGTRRRFYERPVENAIVMSKMYQNVEF